MPRPIRFHLMRHGESEWNVEGRLQGQAHHPALTEKGIKQVRAAARRLDQTLPLGPIAVVSSDLVRATQSAGIVAMVLGRKRPVSVAEHVRLREQGVGDMEGRLTAELRSRPCDESTSAAPGQHISEIGWGGGESVRDVYQRVESIFTEFMADDTLTPDVVVVSHGITMAVTRAWFAGAGHRNVDFDVSWGNAEVRTLTVADAANTRHLV